MWRHHPQHPPARPWHQENIGASQGPPIPLCVRGSHRELCDIFTPYTWGGQVLTPLHCTPRAALQHPKTSPAPPPPTALCASPHCRPLPPLCPPSLSPTPAPAPCTAPQTHPHPIPAPPAMHPRVPPLLHDGCGLPMPLIEQPERGGRRRGRSSPNRGGPNQAGANRGGPRPAQHPHCRPLHSAALGSTRLRSAQLGFARLNSTLLGAPRLNPARPPVTVQAGPAPCWPRPRPAPPPAPLRRPGHSCAELAGAQRGLSGGSAGAPRGRPSSPPGPASRRFVPKTLLKL